MKRTSLFISLSASLLTATMALSPLSSIAVEPPGGSSSSMQSSSMQSSDASSSSSNPNASYCSFLTGKTYSALSVSGTFTLYGTPEDGGDVTVSYHSWSTNPTYWVYTNRVNTRPAPGVNEIQTIYTYSPNPATTPAGVTIYVQKNVTVTLNDGTHTTKNYYTTLLTEGVNPTSSNSRGYPYFNSAIDCD